MTSFATATRLRDAFLYVCKWCGLFRLSRYVTSDGLRILCYHGFATNDEADFRPGLFITLPTFERRLKTLREYGYPVVGLTKALSNMDRSELDSGTTVITVDDAFYGFAAHAVPLLRQCGFPSTAYVTSYYCSKATPVFRLIVRYMFWKSTRPAIDLRDLDQSLRGRVPLGGAEAKKAEEHVIEFGEAQEGETRRLALARRLGELLDVDFDQLAQQRIFNIVTPSEVRGLVSVGVDVQLHTHRHRLPERERDVLQELDDNRRVLEPLVGKALQHLCYPSGIWSPTVWPWLESADVLSATTCDPGLNYRGEPRLALKRILDAENVSQISFEAEMSGWKECLRQSRSRVLALLDRFRPRGSLKQTPVQPQ